MAISTIRTRGRILIPAEIRARHRLTPGMEIDVVDRGGVIQLLVKRPASADPEAGYGMIRIERGDRPRSGKRLVDADAALLLRRPAAGG